MKLPVVSGMETVKALSKVDFYIKHRKSSHMILRRDNPFAQVSVPDAVIVRKEDGKKLCVLVPVNALRFKYKKR